MPDRHGGPSSFAPEIGENIHEEDDEFARSHTAIEQPRQAQPRTPPRERPPSPSPERIDELFRFIREDHMKKKSVAPKTFDSYKMHWRESIRPRGRKLDAARVRGTLSKAEKDKLLNPATEEAKLVRFAKLRPKDVEYTVLKGIEEEKDNNKAQIIKNQVDMANAQMKQTDQHENAMIRLNLTSFFSEKLQRAKNEIE